MTLTRRDFARLAAAALPASSNRAGVVNTNGHRLTSYQGHHISNYLASASNRNYFTSTVTFCWALSLSPILRMTGCGPESMLVGTYAVS